MTQTITASSIPTFYVAHNNNNVVHFGIVLPGSVVTTGQQVLEEYDTAELMARRVYLLQPTLFETIEDELNPSKFSHGDILTYDSEVLVRTDNDTTPWAVVDTSPES